ncbi:MAG: hypothetical protein OXT74_02225 [Candidatus Poribacteria bacterium]|nr:hypothetical protein [Candidatus Poribacteria bacterium]
MKRLILLLLLPLLACSETEERPLPEPEPPMPTISITPSGWGSTSLLKDKHITRRAHFYLVSDIPMPNTTYILVEERFVRMAKGTLRSERVLFSKICPPLTINYSTPYFEPQIKPMDQRSRHLPYHEGDIQLPEGYQFNPYKARDQPAIRLGMWCE